MHDFFKYCMSAVHKKKGYFLEEIAKQIDDEYAQIRVSSHANGYVLRKNMFWKKKHTYTHNEACLTSRAHA